MSPIETDLTTSCAENHHIISQTTWELITDVLATDNLVGMLNLGMMSQVITNLIGRDRILYSIQLGLCNDTRPSRWGGG